jgi:hypothetical protein
MGWCVVSSDLHPSNLLHSTSSSTAQEIGLLVCTDAVT